MKNKMKRVFHIMKVLQLCSIAERKVLEDLVEENKDFFVLKEIEHTTLCFIIYFGSIYECK